MPPWHGPDKSKAKDAAISRARIAASRQRALARRKPSQFPFNFCEADGCGSYDGVYYDPETRKHMCGEHWMNTPRPKVAKVTESEPTVPGSEYA